MSSQIQPFELFALLYARHTGRSAALNYLGGADFHDAESDLDYYVWVARRQGEIFLIDTGFGESAAQARGRQILTPVNEALKSIDIHPAAIKNIIITHLHYDHAGTLDNFPSATFHLQSAEAEYATGPCMCHSVLRHPYDVEDIVSYVRKLFGGQVKFHQGTSQLSPGLSVHLVGGHTAGIQVVRVWTKRGWVVLASDATHLYGNIERNHPFPAVHNVQAMLNAYQTVRELADSEDHIIPGHDPAVMHKYPSLNQELANKVVRLDVPPIA